MKYLKNREYELFVIDWDSNLFFQFSRLSRIGLYALLFIAFSGCLYTESYFSSFLVFLIGTPAILFFNWWENRRNKIKKVIRIKVNKDTTTLKYIEQRGVEKTIVLKNMTLKTTMEITDNENGNDHYILTIHSPEEGEFQCLSDNGLWDGRIDVPKIQKRLQKYYALI